MKTTTLGIHVACALSLAACGVPPQVRGTFLSATVERNRIEFPLGQVRTAEVGDSIYEHGDKTSTKTRTARLLAPVTTTLDLGHSLNLAAGAGGPLLTRSEGGEPALCFPTTGVGQAVTLMSGSTGATIACLIDVDKDGKFDYSMFSTREKYFELSAKTPYSTAIVESSAEAKGTLRVDFLFQGFARGVLRFSYREFRDGIARPAFTQDLTYEAEANGAATIGFKGMRLKVIGADNQKITYVVERGISM